MNNTETAACAAPKKICLCGSARFFQDFKDVELELTITGHIVWTILNMSEWDAIPKEIRDTINAAHLRKIDDCDQVVVINRDGYIGEDTKREIEYATAKGKPVAYWWPKQHTAEAISGSLHQPGSASAVEKSNVYKCKCGWTGGHEQLNANASGIGTCPSCWANGYMLTIPTLTQNSSSTERNP